MNYCEYCKREFKSIQGLLGHNRMKHNSSTAEYRDSSTGSTEHSGPNTGRAEGSTSQHDQTWEELLFDHGDSSAGLPIVHLGQQGDTLARTEHSLENLSALMDQLVSKVADLEQHQHGGDLGCDECHQQQHQLVEQGRLKAWKEAEAILGFFEMQDFNQWATQHEREHPNFPVVHSWWEVPDIQKLIEKYKVGTSVINIV